jgi:hypothetical protein
LESVLGFVAPWMWAPSLLCVSFLEQSFLHFHLSHRLIIKHGIKTWFSEWGDWNSSTWSERVCFHLHSWEKTYKGLGVCDQNKHTKKIHIVQGCIYKPLIVWGNICVCVSNIGFYLGVHMLYPWWCTQVLKLFFIFGWVAWSNELIPFDLFIEPLQKKFPSFKIDFWAHSFFGWSCKA